MDVVCEVLKQAAVKGVESAGFVRVRGEARNLGSDGIEIVARGDCPCGLGTSGFALRTMRSMVDCGTANYMEEHFRAMGLRHIEHDRAEGRWAD